MGRHENNDRHDTADWSMMAYYAALVAVGLTPFFGAASPGVVEVIGQFSLLFSAAYALGGIAGAVSRWYFARAAELWALVLIAGATCLHGVLLWFAGGWSGLQSGLRLIEAPLMMIPYALLRRRHVISARDLEGIARATKESD